MAENSHKTQDIGDIVRTDTIVALATPTGAGALSLVRISGPDSVRVAGGFLRQRGGYRRGDWPERKARLMDVRENGRLIDKVIAVLYRAPRSFTGENVVEVSCHGSKYIVSRIISLALENGARIARPGEFSLRAFLNGKLDLAQAEGICDLITARTESAHRAAISQVDGGVSERISSIKTRIVASLAEIEARLEDSDEEIPPINIGEYLSSLESIASETRVMADSFHAGRFIKDGLKVSITGAPNSGKSSLLNSLLGRDRAIVSESPGTTRDTIEETLDVDGQEIMLIDTAGIREHALDPAEKEGMERTRKAILKSDIVLWLTDACNIPNAGGEARGALRAGLFYRRPLRSRSFRARSAAPQLPSVAALPRDTARSQDEKVGDEISRNAKSGCVVLRVFNKMDLCVPQNLKDCMDAVYISCRTGDGITELKKMMASAAGAPGKEETACVITSARHYEALSRAWKELVCAQKVLGPECGMELAAVHLKDALGELESIVGETTSEDILSAVFERFCVGK